MMRFVRVFLAGATGVIGRWAGAEARSRGSRCHWDDAFGRQDRLLRELGAMRVPKLVARMMAGEFAVYAMTGQPGASNARFKDAVGWEPQYPTFRDGFARGLDEGETDGST